MTPRAIKVDFTSTFANLGEAAVAAKQAEERGYDGIRVAEAKSDALIASALAAERTERVQIGTSVAIAFARNPMTVAVQANDLQMFSGGRFALGLGTQVKAHVTRRFSMPYSHPAARMREFVLAIRAIWAAWERSEELRFEGDYYTHTLMTPFFDPGPNAHGNPPIHLAAVGPRMTAVAGEVGDGMICHPFSTERYVREVTIPRLEEARAQAGKTMAGFELTAPGFVVAGESRDQRKRGVEYVKKQIGFYGSTPAYRPVLELHGWGELGDRLNVMTKRGEWERLESLIDDEVLAAFAVVGTPAEVATELRLRWGDVATRISISVPGCAEIDTWGTALGRLREGVDNAG